MQHEEFADTIVDIIRALVAAHRTGDQAAIMDALGRLLVTTARYANPERRRDEALGRALRHT